jgi:hypothetical protein
MENLSVLGGHKSQKNTTTTDERESLNSYSLALLTRRTQLFRFNIIKVYFIKNSKRVVQSHTMRVDLVDKYKQSFRLLTSP